MANVVKIPLEQVSSSNLEALGFDPDRKRAAVQFKNGKIIYYAGISQEVMTTWYGSPSLGKYYAQNIRGKYQGELMTGECPKCGDGPGFGGDKCESCGCAEYVIPQREVASGK